nr:hypothetical protein CFP56_37916 [Quercus suber]
MSLNAREGEELGLDDELSTKNFTMGADDGSGVLLPVVREDDQPPTVEYVQTEEAAKFHEEINEVPMVLEVEDMILDLVVLGSRDSGEIFEERLDEIDKALARFDMVRGVTLGVNLEGKNEGNKEQRTARRAESTLKSVKSNADNSADVMGTTQPHVQEENLQGRQWLAPKQRTELVRWQSPTEDSVKANFDRAVFREDQEAGIGMVIRNKEGQVLAALSEKVMILVKILEMLAAQRAAIFAQELGFRQVCFEGDVELVVKSL